MLVSKRKNNIPKDLTISVNDMNIKPNDSSKLLRIILDNKLNFEKHISSICKFASCQLNVLFRLKKFQGIKGRKVLIESFFYSSFKYFPLVWHFCNQKSHKRLKTYKKEPFDSFRMTILAAKMVFQKIQTKSTMTIPSLRKLCPEIN